MTAFTGTIPDFSTLEELTSSDMQALSDALSSLTEPMSSYTCAVTASTTAPAGLTVSAKYRQTGKRVEFQIEVTFGSGSAGSGSYSFSLPVASAGTTGQVMGPVTVLDASTPGVYITGLTAWQNTSTTIAVSGSAGTRLGNASTGIAAITWATGDTWKIKGWYDAS